MTESQEVFYILAGWRRCVDCKRLHAPDDLFTEDLPATWVCLSCAGEGWAAETCLFCTTTVSVLIDAT